MDLGLKGQKALITGSSKGIGKATAIEVAREGANVVITGRSEETVKQVVDEIAAKFPETKPEGVVVDLSSTSQRKGLLDKVPEVDLFSKQHGNF